ncbi:hypothetical protein [Cupriavidus metallidurans]|uniref:hypothetical protein n=1 Tax=Cupriavidus metallidurans TaxID=119219 RepID=UPI00068A4DCC|nr:hypothetical protein [Cupriavidus metallidurans]MDE4916307.1 hypothetical protein [Cupriavidus metallidurans]
MLEKLKSTNATMDKPLSDTRRQLLVKLESIIGNSCYNANIQNYGPGGVRIADGRAFRYPLSVRSPNGEVTKVKSHSVPDSIPSDDLLSGYYAFGANQLDVMGGLDEILRYLERHHGLIIKK